MGRLEILDYTLPAYPGAVWSKARTAKVFGLDEKFWDVTDRNRQFNPIWVSEMPAFGQMSKVSGEE